MGRPDPDTEPPRIVSVALGVALYGIAWGQDHRSGTGWHSATDRDVPAERLTAAQWQALTAASVTSEAALDAALAQGPAARAWSKAKTHAEAVAPGGAAALLTACRGRYAAWHGAPLGSPWITG